MSQYDYAVYRDRQNHTCIVLKDTGKSVEFIAMGNEFLVGKMDGKEFHAEYKAMPEYPVKRAAEQYLAFAALTAGLTGKAREHLDGIVADPTLEYDRTQFNPVPKPSKEKHIMAAAKKTAAPAKAAGKKESLVTRAAKPGKAAVENESGGSPIPKVSKYAGKKIKKLADHSAREGSIRAALLDAILGAKNTDDVLGTEVSSADGSKSEVVTPGHIGWAEKNELIAIS